MTNTPPQNVGPESTPHGDSDECRTVPVSGKTKVTLKKVDQTSSKNKVKMGASKIPISPQNPVTEVGTEKILEKNVQEKPISPQNPVQEKSTKKNIEKNVEGNLIEKGDPISPQNPVQEKSTKKNVDENLIEKGDPISPQNPVQEKSTEKNIEKNVEGNLVEKGDPISPQNPVQEKSTEKNIEKNVEGNLIEKGDPISPQNPANVEKLVDKNVVEKGDPISPQNPANVEKLVDKNMEENVEIGAHSPEQNLVEPNLLSSQNIIPETTGEKRTADAAAKPTKRRKADVTLDSSLEQLLTSLHVSGVIPDPLDVNVQAYVLSVCHLIRSTPSNKSKFLLAGINHVAKEIDASAENVRVVININDDSGDEVVLAARGTASELQVLAVDSDAKSELARMFSLVTMDKLFGMIRGLEQKVLGESIKDFLVRLASTDDKFQIARDLSLEAKNSSKVYMIMATFSSTVYAAQVLCEILENEIQNGKNRSGETIPLDVLMRLVILKKSCDKKYGVETQKNYLNWVFPSGMGVLQTKAFRTGVAMLMVCAKLGLSSIMFPGLVYKMWIINKIRMVDLRDVLLESPHVDHVKFCVESTYVQLQGLGYVEALERTLPYFRVSGDILDLFNHVLI